MPSISPSLTAAMADVANAVNETMQRILPKSDFAEQKLFDAMRYSVLAGGKRLRPFLLMSTAKIFGVDEDCALRAAVAIECLHCYSLVHDDLPAMDNSELRRGQPTTHVKYDEATAILAGDALLTIAFEILSDPRTHEDPKIRCALVSSLARASGANGMIGGQMLDLIAETTSLDIGAITRLQRMKTGELIACATEMGAILGRASQAHLSALRAYAHDLGLAFQIIDDLLDAEGTEAETGKPVGRDEQAGKATFVTILGHDRARHQAKLLSEQAIQHLSVFDGRAKHLEEVARFVIDRKA
ncbi:MAG: polyprenyl synthetase family protein [Proteobacteria bacterium]|jgi:farnesyl diphosphate synthase|nr:polyprenyl synthetase family protein [Alphaproteobacteria bacterium]NCC03936.1 polyprenyl synthetase family protein [Pseudomonadota bacterium]